MGSNQLLVGLLGSVEGCLELCRGDVVAVAVESPLVGPGGPRERCQLEVLAAGLAPPGSSAANAKTSSAWSTPSWPRKNKPPNGTSSLSKPAPSPLRPACSASRPSQQRALLSKHWSPASRSRAAPRYAPLSGYRSTEHTRRRRTLPPSERSDHRQGRRAPGRSRASPPTGRAAEPAASARVNLAGLRSPAILLQLLRV